MAVMVKPAPSGFRVVETVVPLEKRGLKAWKRAELPAGDCVEDLDQRTQFPAPVR